MRLEPSGVLGAALTLSLAAFVAGVASADAISMPECTHGWTAQYAGHSAYCAPHVCTSDGDSGGGRCMDVARCFRAQPMDTGMVMVPPGTPPQTFEEPLDVLCSADGSCGIGTHCTHERECTEPPTSRCSIGHRSSASTAVAFSAVLVLAIGRRRRVDRRRDS
jgi:hypothetical protein